MPIFSHNCERDGHHFEPRYDRGSIPEGNLKYTGSVDDLEVLCSRTYVGDICTYCGKTVFRESFSSKE